MKERWLAIDTATDIASVAVDAGGETVARAIRGAREHAAKILPLVQEVLTLARLSLTDISGIIVGDGPGSFTGLRIGWAAAKGLAHEHQLPLVAIPSLLGAAHAAGVNVAAACYDALRGEVFGAVYAFEGDQVKTIVTPDLYTIPTLAVRARQSPDLAVGDGSELDRKTVVAWTGRAPVGIAELPPIAGSLLALVAYDRARSAIDRNLAEPVYGRRAEAQVKWEARYGRPLPHSSR
ncbi:MAG TPA: tRNA (adenosine(37)-N6)-threonylcarbamoyltransferase complex dimerization subunit type 1 TsaB [Gemmatimonadales bacterium]|nr:tRNA (adenosine(37)-N6)-threonylcarbamoyltransferase complex dimerization subunit type 1 TsaB [Gemmatimonadales bacterium]